MSSHNILPGSIAAAARFLAVTVLCLSFAACHRRAAAGPLDRAEVALAAGRYKEALPIIQAEVIKAPADAELVQWLGLTFWKLGQPDKAAECFESALRLLPADPRPAEYLGRVEMQRKRWLNAESALVRSLRSAPKNPRAWTALAMVKLATNNVDAAQSYFREAIRLQTNYPPALYNLAWASYYRSHNNTDASSFYRRYLAVSEDTVRATRARAILKKIDEGAAPRKPTGKAPTTRRATAPR